MPQTARRGILLAAAAFACWGLLSPGNEILLRSYGPMWMQAVRGTIAVAVLVMWLGPRRVVPAMRLWAFPGWGLGWAFFFGTFASFALFSFSQTRVDAAFTTLGFYTAPLWTALLARVLLGERVGAVFVPAVGVILGGGYMALGAGDVVPDALGMALAVGSGLAWGAYAVLLRGHGEGYDWRLLLLSGMLLSLLLFWVAAAFEAPPDFAAFSAKVWLWTGIQVAVPTLAAFGLYQAALQRSPAARVNLLVGVELAATVLFAALLLQARFTMTQLLGVALVLAAVPAYLWLQGRRPVQKSD